MNTAAAVASYFEGLHQRFQTGRDRRAVFVAAYLEITRGVKARIDQGGFRDNAWTERYLVEFARLYREALESYDAGDLVRCPKAWRIAFDCAVNGETSVMQDLALGMNAHINGDLPHALLAAGLDPDRERRHADHNTVNEVLRAHTDRVQQAVGAQYAPVLLALDFAAGRADELVAGFAVEKARDSAWRKAVLLNDAPGMLRAAFREVFAEETALLARAIRLPTAVNPALRAALRKIDEQSLLFV